MRKTLFWLAASAMVSTPSMATEAPTPISNLQIEHRIEAASAPDTAFIWQGLDHEWLRYLISEDEGRIPHRISKFHNYIDGESLALPAQAVARIHFGQNTGVDGNYMKPRSFFSAVQAVGVGITRGQVVLSWTDNVVGDEHPVANNRIRQLIEIPLDNPRHNHGRHSEHAVVLRGIELDASCDDAKQPADKPCNSNGLWPYVFNIAIEQCEKTPGHTLSCGLAVDIYRAWTPNQGGVNIADAGIVTEIKPLNRSLDYQLKVYYTLFSGDEEQLKVTPAAPATAQNRILAEPVSQQLSVTGSTARHYPAASLGISRFGFTLLDPQHVIPLWKLVGSADTSNRGRYIGRLQFQTQQLGYQPGSARLDYSLTTGVWSPPSVVDSLVQYQMQHSLLQFGEASVQTSHSAQGTLCINSSEQAPFFSYWKNCDLQQELFSEEYGGQEQSEDTQAVVVEF